VNHLFHAVDVRRLPMRALVDTGMSFHEFAQKLAHERYRTSEQIEWWARREAARCRDEIIDRQKGKVRT
jgi:hypothetical protein